MLNESIKLLYVDLFCGAGGTSTGVENARINDSQCAKVIACVNHDKNAIASHSLNHPDTLHFTEDIRTLELSSLVEHVEKMRKLYPNALLVLWASLECTNFSKAKGGQPRDGDSRTLAEHLFRYMDALQSEYIHIENVEEFMTWGPIDINGMPIKENKGDDYSVWVENVCNYGYGHEFRILNSADYGAYTARKRLFIQFAKTGLPISWPEPTHKKVTLNTGLSKWKSVGDILELNDEGVSIFSRKKPLSDNTLRRIYAGLLKFIAGGDKNFLSSYYGNGANVSSIEAPSPTVTTKDRIALVSPNFIDQQFGNSKPVSTNQPCGALTTNPKYALVTVKHRHLMNPQFNSSGGSIEDPCFTLIARMDKMPPYLVVSEEGESLHRVTEKDSEHAIKIKEFMSAYRIYDVKMRMLKISELKVIMGFPKSYTLIGTQADQKKFIGNAVEVTISRAMCESVSSGLDKLNKIAV